MQPFEKLGSFYLGRRYDIDEGAVRDDLVLYDARDLTTHAVCVGMTGSGKTGLCVSLLEEAAIDGVPALAIDPKGDLGNLMLAFPELRASDFRPWVDDGEASRKGLTADEYAKKTAATWRDGLASWGQDGERIRRFTEAAERTIYTPGSSAGLPLSTLRSLAAPPPALLEDGDALRERVSAAVSALLALLGIEADPIRSREHILLSTIATEAWRGGRDLTLSSLIREIQEPPFERVGVFELESFFPAKQRFELAMILNNLIASPGFASWLEGEPLDVASLLWTPEGRPRLSILSIAHLSDAERMFFVTMLLNEVVAWMRTQPGSTSLRALLYMDEVFGYLPPTANPPSKTPMLTLLKQARAFGLGIVLATQNPVDLDYKALSNAGTWFLGRLQTERDKARVLEGLEGVAAAGSGTLDRARLDKILARLDSRVFLMNNVHEDEPVLMHTRWAMSYLRGPLTRAQIRTLAEPGRTREHDRGAARPVPASSAATSAATAAEAPVLPPSIEQRYEPPARAAAAGTALTYRPALLGRARLHFVQARQGIDEWRDVALIAGVPDGDGEQPWDEAQEYDAGARRLDTAPLAGARFADLPAPAALAKSYRDWKKSLADHAYQSRELELWHSQELKETSSPGETERDFRVRLSQALREKRDLEIEKLRSKFTPKLSTLQDRIARAEERVEREQSQLSHQKMQTAISVGATVLGALFGRKAISAGSVGRATTAMRGASRTKREKADVERAESQVERLREDLQEMERDFEQQAAELRRDIDPASLEIESRALRPRKSDISAGDVVLVWRPWKISADGLAEPAFE